jgi:hypothetical protein
MKMRRAGGIILLCMLASCSREDSMYSMAPAFQARSDAALPAVAQCIESRWTSGTRDLISTDRGGVIRVRAQTFFGGVKIGVRLQRDSGKTRVEYFEQRYADRVYVGMVKGCLDPDSDKQAEK